ncbi:hypothetical protein DL95DRAFT_392555 [Leptodontidium sp. 2 PMI_412]|nr:hypothetical protein BKA61DRAFT_567010 [Leptodontidium sp. MPI-SDFR-AT-0119]KAH9211388.1 hypothetical protein DL95DRAFT_392555 [Leptodontidium sp. 2 PMI_412]
MKPSTLIAALFPLAIVAVALGSNGHALARVRGLGLAQRQAEPPVIQREECEKLVSDGFGNDNSVACDKSEEGVDGCACQIRSTQVRCTRVLDDGTGNSSLESCQQSEEGVDGCKCGETVATQKVIRCTRVLDDGTGNTSLEQCGQNEEGVDGCKCGETVDVL